MIIKFSIDKLVLLVEVDLVVDKVTLIGMNWLLTLTKLFITIVKISLFLFPVPSINMQTMNLGVSESSKYSMNLKNPVLFSTLNVTTRELPMNFVENHLTSEKITFPPSLDQSNYHHKED